MWKTWVSPLVYIVLLNASFMTVTICLHELGHFFLGLELGCSWGRIILIDSKNFHTYTELECTNVSKRLLALGAFIFVVPFAFLFLILKIPERNFCWTILGLGLFSGGVDLVEIFKLPFLYHFSIIMGIGLICFAELRLSDKILLKTYLTRARKY